ncbi:MAG: signal peptidase II [Actinomycetota bacterium]|nr:signal peptidase II [Actinomycetota bacterium]
MTATSGIVVDQISKAVVVARISGHPPVHIIGSVLMLDESRNPGAAFSFAPAATVVFALLALAISVLIVRTAKRSRSILWAVTLGLILAGALSNLIDRLVRSPGFGRGAVVDFIYVEHFATFNVADSCITCGAALAALLVLRGVPFASEDETVGVDGDAGT